ncbi:hypothetical protein QBC44DRAFT_328814 [Cladorrhinum sp. PSN332]|nr:hypothetical protein QBC44DRAFT_328814 [Cladorrhinum sp. PSN332]
MAPSLHNLPYETTIQIARLIAPNHHPTEWMLAAKDRAPPDSHKAVHLARFCRVSRRLHDILQPLLYENVFIYVDRAGQLSWPNIWSGPLFARSLLENSELRLKIRHLTIQTSHEYPLSEELPPADFVSVTKTWKLANLSQRDRYLLDLTRLPLLQQIDERESLHRMYLYKNWTCGCMHWQFPFPPPSPAILPPAIPTGRCADGFYEQEHHIIALILALVPELETLSLGVSLYSGRQNYLSCLLDEFILGKLVHPPPLQNLRTLHVHAMNDVNAGYYPLIASARNNPFVCPSILTVPNLRSVHVRHDSGHRDNFATAQDLGLGDKPLPIASLTLTGSFTDQTAAANITPLLHFAPSLISLSLTKTPPMNNTQPNLVGLQPRYLDTQPISLATTLNSILPSLSGTLTSLRLLGCAIDSVNLFSPEDQHRVTALPRLPLLSTLEISLSVLFRPNVDWATADLASLLPPNLETLAIQDDWLPNPPVSAAYRAPSLVQLGKTLESGERGRKLISLILGLGDGQDCDGRKMFKLPKLRQIKMIKAETLVAHPGLEEALIAGFEGTGVKVDVDSDIEGGVYTRLVNSKLWKEVAPTYFARLAGGTARDVREELLRLQFSL